MRPPSSKNSKRTSDEDRSRKKKKKPRSSKRRRDPSISSYSSSDSDVDSRSRRKSKKSKKTEKSDKNKKETKKIEKKRSRKKRYRRDSSVSSLSSYSSRSCSTCSDLRRSRSPVKQRADRKSSKSNPRKRERERGRKISRHHKSNHGDRRRSPRCSTCSRSSASSSRSRGRSPIVERYREEGETKRLRSVLAVSRVDDEGKDKIIKAYDDYPTYQSDDIYDEGKKKDQNIEEDSYDTQISERVDSLKDMSRLARDSDVDHDDGSAKDYPVTKGSQLVMSFDDRYEGSLVAESESTKNYTVTKGPEVAVDDSGKEAANLELILRQKALENLRKFKVASKLERNQGSKICAKTLELELSHPNYLEEQKHAQGASSSSELKAMSVPSMATEKNEGNGVRNPLIKSGSCVLGTSSTISCKAPNNLKLPEKSSNKISSEEILLAKDADNKRIAAQPGSGESTGAEIGLTDRPSSGAINTESEPIKPLLESASGSQFENKTFSRVHDGEMVQVSYKVYIPKKTPALARRQLQR